MINNPGGCLSGRALTREQLSQSLLARFAANTEKTEGGCWNWTGTMHPKGYGQVNDGRRKNYYAHRVALVIAHGSIGFGTVVDHLCKNRRCVNPEHLRVGTPHDNWQSGDTKSAVVARTGVCGSGRHTMEHVYRRRLRTGKECRRCALCQKEQAAAFRQANRDRLAEASRARYWRRKREMESAQ